MLNILINDYSYIISHGEKIIMCFKIVQKLNIEWVDDELLDYNEHTVGYVEDEFFAQEFCNKHSDCYYYPIHFIKYPLHLECNLIDKDTELEAVVIPIIKPEE